MCLSDKSVEAMNRLESGKNQKSKNNKIDMNEFVSQMENMNNEYDDLAKDEYIVEEVIDFRINSSHEREYQVTWKGYGNEKSWIPASAFKDAYTLKLKTKRGRAMIHTIKPGEEIQSKKRCKVEIPSQKSKVKESKVKESKVKESKKRKGNIDISNSVKVKKVQPKRSIMEMVCPWGGQVDGYKMTNTCTIDHVLSCLFLQYSLNDSFKLEIHRLQHGDKVSDVLLHVFQVVLDGKDENISDSWTRGRKIWLGRTLEEDVQNKVC